MSGENKATLTAHECLDYAAKAVYALHQCERRLETRKKLSDESAAILGDPTEDHALRLPELRAEVEAWYDEVMQRDVTLLKHIEESPVHDARCVPGYVWACEIELDLLRAEYERERAERARTKAMAEVL